MKKIETESSASFNFDYWCELAKNNPEKFEKERSAAIEEVITAAPKAETRDRLRKLQWRVDAERKISKDPTQACLKIYNMMWDKVYGDDGLLHSLNILLECSTGKAADKQEVELRKSADILAFPAVTAT